MEQELFQNVKAFLEKEKGCSNIESEVTIAENPPQLQIKGLDQETKKFGRMDIVGGKFYKDEYYREKNHAYTCIELHCIEYKSRQDEILKGIGQLFWYKFSMSVLHLWTDRLFLYLMIDEDRVSEKLKEFCSVFGFGLLQVNPAKIVTEVVTPENQCGFVARMAQDKLALRCPKCYKSFLAREFKCPQCGTELKAEAFWNLFADNFQIATGNAMYKGVPDHMPPRVQEMPLLKKVFANWARVQQAWGNK